MQSVKPLCIVVKDELERYLDLCQRSRKNIGAIRDELTYDLVQQLMSKSLNNTYATMRKKPKKDPNFPKRNRSAYLFFSSEYWKKLKERDPDSKHDRLKVVAEISAKWKALKPAQRKKYDTLADEDKLRYAKELKTYTPSDGYEIPERQGRDPLRPKGARSAYLFWTMQVRPEVTESMAPCAATEVTAELSRRWKEMSDEDKQEYQEQANDDRERYEREITIYNREHGILPCEYEFTRGKRCGEICGKPSIEGTEFCVSHAPPDPINGCQFPITRGPNEGSVCGKRPKRGERYCTTHYNREFGPAKPAKPRKSKSNTTIQRPEPEEEVDVEDGDDVLENLEEAEYTSDEEFELEDDSD